MALKRAAAINDISGVGRCSLTAAIPILSAMSVQVCPVPTAVLTNQTGFDSYYMDDYTDKIDNYTDEWKKLGLTFDAVCTGFLSTPKQVDAIKRFVNEFKTDDTLLLVDPVMADNGMIYGTYSEELCRKLTQFAFTADVVTPNLTEACILANADYNEYLKYIESGGFESRIFGLAREISEKGPKAVVITGVEATENKERFIYSFSFDSTDNSESVVKNKAFGNGYSGTGDIASSIICGELLRNKSLSAALESACGFLEKAAQRTFENSGDRNEGVEFEPLLHLLCE